MDTPRRTENAGCALVTYGASVQDRKVGRNENAPLLSEKRFYFSFFFYFFFFLSRIKRKISKGDLLPREMPTQPAAKISLCLARARLSTIFRSSSRNFSVYYTLTLACRSFRGNSPRVILPSFRIEAYLAFYVSPIVGAGSLLFTGWDRISDFA